MSRLLLVPLEDLVVFPGMSLTLPVDAGEEERVLLVPRHGQEFAAIGTVAEVSDRVRLPGGARAVALQALHRGVAGAAHTLPDSRLFVEVEERPDEVPVDGRTRNLEREYRAVVEEILELRGDDGRVAAFVRSITEPGALADTAGYSPDLSYEQKVKLLQTLDVSERLELAHGYQRERLAELQVRKRIRDDVESGAEKQQRDYFLRKQMESIRKELGEDDASVVDEYRTKIEEAGMPEAVREQADKELGRLERLGEQSAESSVIRTYLDWLIAVPWGQRSEERLDPAHAREVLDTDHAGLEDVKDRIVEYIAVKKLRQERGIVEDKRSGAILTLIGPPGTGKTSIGESIARGYLWPRQLERNGLRTEEVDISDELLETVLVEYTREAGVRQLERDLGTLLRKVATRIASGQAQAPVTVELTTVRDALGRQRHFQESAIRTAVPGVATGLAVTGTGGDVLFIEATAMQGKPGLTLTGQLGDVMKESAQIALSYVRGHAPKLDIDPASFEDRSFHIHVPAGAIPKDGPSAGVTMVTALASLLSGRPVKHTVGMTGEVTLQGRVLPIGGVKQKVLAAHAAGLTDVVLPERNRGDLDDVPAEVRDAMSFHFAMTVDEVLGVALEHAALRQAA
jgi:ATP-dependent Lon protease